MIGMNIEHTEISDRNGKENSTMSRFAASCLIVSSFSNNIAYNKNFGLQNLMQVGIVTCYLVTYSYTDHKNREQNDILLSALFLGLFAILFMAIIS